MLVHIYIAIAQRTLHFIRSMFIKCKSIRQVFANLKIYFNVL